MDEARPEVGPDIPFETWDEKASRVTQPIPSLPVFDVADFEGKPVPPRKWHVDGLIPGENVTLFMADGAVGKSTLAAQLSGATILGRPWLGFPCTQGPVIVLGAEDDLGEFHRRFDAFKENASVRYADLRGLKIIPLAGKDAVLAAADGIGLKTTELFRAFERLIEQVRPALVILDVVADLFAGDENRKPQVRAFITALRGLAIRYGLAVVLFGHPSQSGKSSGEGTSGNVAWSNSVRSRLYLNRVIGKDGLEADPDFRVLTVMKANFVQKGATVMLRWRDGLFEVADGGGAAASAAGSDRAEAAFLDMLDRVTKEGRPVSPSPSASYAPTVFADHADAMGVTKRAFQLAMDRLFKAGRIVVEEKGPPSKRRSRIVIASPKTEAEDILF